MVFRDAQCSLIFRLGQRIPETTFLILVDLVVVAPVPLAPPPLPAGPTEKVLNGGSRRRGPGAFGTATVARWTSREGPGTYKMATMNDFPRHLHRWRLHQLILRRIPEGQASRSESAQFEQPNAHMWKQDPLFHLPHRGERRFLFRLVSVELWSRGVQDLPSTVHAALALPPIPSDV
jgi:hypothetical protein